ncbi:FAD-dependent monooxygenase [Amycolatopsis balhimycina DSM 5908]|uniref:FAD-dependent monooxygenase n=1 Tax=Amycolatopsis balhimycina DSM 5908 TaxID=1081091 RepID=A0A428WPE1_AMYBA|nr:NAD(P)/FAD-dependent oxidoreductase [Amycolatopsis balhimycina]RSM44923.1 FAD-dependent monooxygenase [Amycolatopsis balhimycina DSM 5908]
MNTLKVLIAGAGLGGLTLAQSLRGHSIDVSLFERDSSPWDRPQGYRLHLDADALNTVAEVLPPAHRAVFDATAQRTEPFTTILDTDLSVIKRLPTVDEHDPATWPHHPVPVGHANVDRATLRQILLHDVEDAVHYDKALTHYENDGKGVTAYFADGTSARGDVLVGADGIRSAVRRQRAPGHDAVDAGITAIYGRLPLKAAEPLVPDPVLTDIFTIAADSRKVFLGLGPVRFPQPPGQAAAELTPGMAMIPREDYLVCIVGGRHEHFPRLAEAATARSRHDLRGLAAYTVRDWPQTVTELFDVADPESFFSVRMSTSVPHGLDEPTNVTLLGDAIHAMTPTLGRGANVAMRDGALLGRALTAVAAGHRELPSALAGYEQSMLSYGFDVVRSAARIGEQRMAQNPLAQ